ncbi:MAG TPA: HD domain-containing phosphohydrolase [Gemmatimonadaceae bacterium]|nr:HD domain-containing phosphohydrolase [Gemmatimonadaceae bacterium]
MREAVNKKKPLVLIVDDDEGIRLLLKRQMEQDGYAVALAADGRSAIAAAGAEPPDLVLLDALMPEMDGFQVAETLKSTDATRNAPVIMVTALGDQESRLRALKAGVQEFLSKPIDRNEVSLRVRNVLVLKEYSNALAEQNRALERRVAERTREVLEGYRETIETLTRAASYKDEETGAHVRRISFYTQELAVALGMNPAFCETIHYASPMHDIGKLAIPDAILRKTGPLTAEEWSVMKSHTTIGAQLVGAGSSPYLQMGAEIALHHHERWNGGGYPAGLKGERIPFSARIMNICDQYDALRSVRSYKKAFAHETVVEIITTGDGRTMPAHFDPDVLAAFKRSAKRFLEIFETLPD